MSRRFIIAGAAAAALVGAAVPAALASTGSPVTVTRDSNGTTVGVTDKGAPVAGATVYNDGKVCGGIGEQVPLCTPAVGDVIGPIGTARTAQSLPITVRHDDTGTTVGVGLGNQPVVAAHVSPNGQACVGISLELPVCTPGIGASSHARQQSPIQPVTVRHDDNGTAVGVGDVGVLISPSGRICPVVSTQDWQCIGGDK